MYNIVFKVFCYVFILFYFLFNIIVFVFLMYLYKNFGEDCFIIN